ncbi:uncharacterized protein [Rutidosis leptorrhynchoides]|uniref:uncharacterized protein n=1 Tax=Rutidosis leptorrhynchoides TaxID=125765 RepID=UPI003A9A5FCC
MNISHMCFADYLLVLCYGNEDSVAVVKNALDSFSKVSGLYSYLGKSTIFFRSICMSTRQNILHIIPLFLSKLSVRYLGIPPISKRLSVGDYKCLIDKVKDKVNNWRNEKLSYAGRLPLINSILSYMHVYWTSVFMLPSTVKGVKEFSLESRDNVNGKAKLAWKIVCTAKESIWDIKVESRDSWNWAKLLSLRDMILDHVHCEIVNGESTSLWFSKQFWEYMKDKILFKGLSHKIGIILEVMARYPFKNQIWSIITRLVITAAVYYIWGKEIVESSKG